jgi:hypothetical protein
VKILHDRHFSVETSHKSSVAPKHTPGLRKQGTLPIRPSRIDFHRKSCPDFFSGITRRFFKVLSREICSETLQKNAFLTDQKYAMMF